MKISIEVKDENKTTIHTVDFEPTESRISSATEKVKTFLKETFIKDKFIKVSKETKESL